MNEIKYEESGIDSRILRAVAEMGFEVMTPIQAQAIPVLMEGKDVIGQAQTGTGKTAAFAIPLLQQVDPAEKGLQCLVLCTTRELAIQAAEEIRHLAKFYQGVKVLPIYGGQDISTQIRSLKSNIQVVVGTPGRIMDHMRRHTLKMDDLKTIVLDEADEMLNMGFREDIETILKEIPQEHQTALFSATMPKPIMQITKLYQKPDAVLVKIEAKELTIPLVKQYYYEVSHKNKEEVVSRLLDYYNPKRTLIFCNTKRMVDELAEKLSGRGYFAEGLHGDLSQAQRDRVMAAFRNGTTEILIATDVAARGIDVDNVEAVFNYDIPQDIEYYVHRIGRTGRAGKKGRSFTLVTGREIYKIREIERICSTKVKVRAVPSASDITAAKSEKILSAVLDTLHENDMESAIRMIEQKLNDEDCTAIELAAAFLRQQMGAEIADLPLDERDDSHRNKRRNDDRRDGRKFADKDKKPDGRRNRDKKSDGRKYGDQGWKDRKPEDRKPGDRKPEERRKSYKPSDSKKRDGKGYDGKYRDEKSGSKERKTSYKKYEENRRHTDKKKWDIDMRTGRDKKADQKA